MPLLVVGAGWAGLSCAVELARIGHEVTVLEAAAEVGGRARRLEVNGMPLDNGQHLLLGAYAHTLAMMETVGVDPAEAFLRLPLGLRVLERDGPVVALRAGPLPAPLHLAWGLATCEGLSIKERLGALGLAVRGFSRPPTAARDCTVAQWLDGQPPRVRRTLWEPMCLAALNTPVEQASAAVFLRVLADAFHHRRRDADLLIPRGDLGGLLPRPARAFIDAHGGQVLTGRRVTGLVQEAGRIAGVATSAGVLRARHVVVATAHHGAARLLAPLPGGAALAADLRRLGHQPICTVYLQYHPATRLGFPMVGLAGGIAQWVFDRAADGRRGLMAVVVSAAGPHMALDRDTLAARVQAELAHHFPAWPPPLWSRVIRERRATFACRAGEQDLRPPHRGPLPGLWLAGDYTRTPYPATLEGAVMSGLQCAREIHHHTEAPP
ncbi:MAG: hydroxysqualene dehydroxylase HpnE [Gammaproteobacteria bacterium]|nr:hydroxysqualene dehydroxylase HpnE [Gammaproteobacteria bacterium]